MSTPITHDKGLLVQCLNQYNNWVADNIDKPVQRLMRMQPIELTSFFADIKELTRQIQTGDVTNKITIVNIEDEDLPLLKRAILHKLHARSVDKECRSELTNDRVLKERLEGEVKEVSDLTENDWFNHIDAFRTPKLTDFLTLQQAVKNKSIALAERQYDEKFHILNAPTLFWEDIQYYRSTCNLRGRPITVAFIDIDDFKVFNSDYGETTVDRDVLPKFMSSLEAHVFSLGHAYRLGGDEYIVLLSNMSSSRACDLFAEFQLQLIKLDYYNIKAGPTVSIGIMEISEDCILTDKECLKMAEEAKGEAKKTKKGSIFINKGLRVSDNSYEKYQANI